MKTLNNLSKKVALSLLTAMMLLSIGLSAQEVTEDRQVGDFKGIDVGGTFDVTLEKGSKTAVKIEADKDMMEHIKTEVSNGILHIKLVKKGVKIKKVKDMNVTITFVNMEVIEASGAVTIESESVIDGSSLKLEFSGASDAELNVEVEKLETEISGATSLEIKGSAADHFINVSGAANLEAGDLKTQNTNIEVSGAANAEVNATEKLNGNISGMGNIQLNGEPKESNITTSGLGEVSTSDTTEISVGGKKFIVIDDEEIDIEDIKKKKDKKFNGHWGGVDIGTNWYMTSGGDMDAPLHNDYLELNKGKSIGVNLNLWEKNFNLVKNRLGLVTGMGFSFRNYRFDNTRTLLGNERDTIYGFVNDDSAFLSTHSASKSKLNTAYLTLPILLEYQIPVGKKKFYVGAGGIGGLKIGSHTKIVYEKGNNKSIEKDHKSFHTNPFYYGARAYIGWGGINVYADYGLSTLFEKNEGPEVYPFSIGIRLAGW